MLSHLSYIEARRRHFNQIVKRFLPDPRQEPVNLHQAMNYTVASGGKRMRPLLVYAVGELLGAKLEVLDSTACCVEFMHTYSLIHDDLPAMDDADFRRELPACHKVYGEATAILAGNALQNLSFELITNNDTLSAEIRLAMIKVLSCAVGSEGVLGGQMLDLESQKQILEVHQIETIHRMKTAALIAGSVRMGALAANCMEEEKLEVFEALADDFGLAFQIGDDILDQHEGGLNIVNQMGLEAAQARMELLYQSVFERLRQLFKEKVNPLRDVIYYVRACH